LFLWREIKKISFFLKKISKQIEFNKIWMTKELFITSCLTKRAKVMRLNIFEEELWHASISGDIKIVEKILELENVNVNWGDDEWNRTPLYKACFHGHVHIVKILLQDPRIDVNKSAHEGFTPFYLACSHGHSEIVKLLLNDERTDVNRTTKQDASPFYIACQEGHLEVVKLLLKDPRIDVNHPLNDQSTPFFIACQNGELEIVKLLLNDQRIDINQTGEEDSTAFWTSCFNGRLEIVKWLLASERKVDIEIKWKGEDRNGYEQAKYNSTAPKKEWERTETETKERQEDCLKISQILENYMNFKERTKFELQKELGILESIACEIYILTVLVCDDYLRIYDENHSIKRIKT